MNERINSLEREKGRGCANTLPKYCPFNRQPSQVSLPLLAMNSCFLTLVCGALRLQFSHQSRLRRDLLMTNMIASSDDLAIRQRFPIDFNFFHFATKSGYPCLPSVF